MGKLSDVAQAVERAETEDMEIGCLVTVADATKCKIYMKNFGEFYNNQIENAGTIILSRTSDMKEEKLQNAVQLLREKNPDAVIVTTPWDQLTGQQLLEAMEQKDSLQAALAALSAMAKRSAMIPNAAATIITMTTNIIMRTVTLTSMLMTMRITTTNITMTTSIITIMRTRCSPPGGWKRPKPTPGSGLRSASVPWKMLIPTA